MKFVKFLKLNYFHHFRHSSNQNQRPKNAHHFQKNKKPEKKYNVWDEENRRVEKVKSYPQYATPVQSPKFTTYPKYAIPTDDLEYEHPNSVPEGMSLAQAKAYENFTFYFFNVIIIMTNISFLIL